MIFRGIYIMVGTDRLRIELHNLSTWAHENIHTHRFETEKHTDVGQIAYDDNLCNDLVSIKYFFYVSPNQILLHSSIWSFPLSVCWTNYSQSNTFIVAIYTLIQIHTNTHTQKRNMEKKHNHAASFRYTQSVFISQWS